MVLPLKFTVTVKFLAVTSAVTTASDSARLTYRHNLKCHFLNIAKLQLVWCKLQVFS